MYSSQLIQQLQVKNTLCLTPNERLANFLHYSYGKEQRAQGYQIWAPPLVYSYHGWLKHLWSSYQITHQLTDLPSPQLLSPLNSTYIWKSILQQHLPNHVLLKVEKILPTVQQAWRYCWEWLVSWEDPQLTSTLDSTFFATCARAYGEYCEQNNCLDEDQLADFLFTYGDLTQWPNQVIWCGFESLTPQQEQWLNLLKNNAITVSEAQLEVARPQQWVHAFIDTETELTAMANWAKNYLKNHPQARIGCVIPQLDSLRPLVQTVFKKILGENTPLSLAPHHLYNISGGYLFHQYPLIQSALQSLQLSFLTAEALSHWLRCSYLTVEERDECHLLDATWREYPLKAGSALDNFLNFAQSKYTDQTNPIFIQKLLQAQTYLKSWPSHLLFNEWIAYFINLLHQLGWPGSQLSPQELQCWQKWIDLLQICCTVDHCLTPITAQTAVYQLTTACHFPFQEETPDAPIQILGLLEAAGLTFEVCWIAQCHDGVWPSEAHPNPYLPLSLQKGMPHSSPEKELSFFQSLTSHFSSCALSVIFSYPQQMGEEKLTLSPLLSHYTLKEFTLPNPQLPLLPLLEALDEKGPAVVMGSSVQGGVSILAHQAVCGFKAFAKIRLKANPLKSFQLTLTAKERGFLIHHVLELFWQQTKNQETLLSLPRQTLIQRINQCIQHALDKLTQKFYLTPTLRQLEANRLQQLCLAWLTFEKDRDEFKIIELESTCQIDLAGLSLQVRIDRIDQLTSGDIVIIDYKTNRCSIQACLVLESPQLPLYAVIKQAQGIYFAEIQPEKVKFIGLTQQDYPAWDEQMEQWREKLHNLARAFLAGEAQVNPAKGLLTCQSCDLNTLCRYEP